MPEIEPKLAKLRVERDRSQPVKVDLPGRLFLPSEEREARCTVLNLSPSGAVLACETLPTPQSQFVLYVDGGFGRFEGSVIGSADGETFAVEFNCTPMKRERTAEQLTLFVNHALDEADVIRRHERHSSKGFLRFARGDGQLVRGEILELSTAAVSLKTDIRPPIGEYVLIGQMAGRIARHHESGIDIVFLGNPEERQTTERVHAKLGVAR